ncbi:MULTISPECIES: hypothetical protein [Paenochrobactrum]|uniref:hypothetical protein n=1 Tax=Paenochrobactrum TaxID=999488 RepID=UPI0035BC58C3
MPGLLNRFAKNRSSASVLEFCLIGVLTFVAIISAVLVVSASSESFAFIPQAMATLFNF